MNSPGLARTYASIVGGGIPSAVHDRQLRVGDRSVSRARARERSQLGRERSSADGNDDIDNEQQDIDRPDDEVLVRDRGEELVRKRQKERKRQRRLASTRLYPVDPFANGGQTPGPETAFSLGGDRSVPPTPGNALGGSLRARSAERGYFPAHSQYASQGYSSEAEVSEGYGSPVPGTPLAARGSSPAPAAARRSHAPSIVDEVIDEVVRDANNGDQDDQDEDDEDEDSSPAEDEGVTVRDRQDAFNVEHMFGLPIWKPALYKKSRSITRNAEVALHSIPSAAAERNLWPGNLLWTILFGWWLAAVAVIGGIFVAVIEILCSVKIGYARTLFGLGWYIFWPFGKFLEGLWVRPQADDEEREPQVGHQAAASRTARARTDSSSSAHTVRPEPNHERQHLSAPSDHHAAGYGTIRSSSVASARIRTQDDARQPMTWRRVLGFAAYYLVLFSTVIPTLLFVCVICWALIFTIPMAKLNWALIKYLVRRPLSINFRSAPNQASETTSKLTPGQIAPTSGPDSTVLLCIYRAIGYQYYKYTIGGVNIIFINLVPLIFFTIFDGLYLLPFVEHHHIRSPLLRLVTSQVLIFILSLASVIPLSYFIGMAVASISVQSSIGMGAVINATFGSIIEVILYGIALTQGKGRLVEGSIVGSILAGVLLMPGASMCSGAVRRKEQKFNAKSAGVTSTMLIMAIIGTLTPTMFYQTYGSFQLHCPGAPASSECHYDHPDPTSDPFYQDQVKTLMYFCACILVLSYLIGLWFSLRTHASQIWQNPQQLMKREDELPSGMHPAHRNAAIQRLTPQSVMQYVLPTTRQPYGKDFSLPPSALASPKGPEAPNGRQRGDAKPAHADGNPALPAELVPGLPPNVSAEEFTRAVAVATVSALKHHASSMGTIRKPPPAAVELPPIEEESPGGHDAPSWSRGKSTAVLLSCTVLYAIIAGGSR